MVKKFKEFIEEGFLSKTLSRVKSGEKRLGDKDPFVDNYINSIEWVDLGHPKYLFAKVDYENNLSYDMIKNMKLPKDISIMDVDTCTWVITNTQRKHEVVDLQDLPEKYSDKFDDDIKFMEYTSEKNGEIIYFTYYYNHLHYFVQFIDGVSELGVVELSLNSNNFKNYVVKSSDSEELDCKLVKLKR